jgi:hypothetical protein
VLRKSLPAWPFVHFQLAETAWFRPGLAYATGPDRPMSDAGHDIVQLDLPFSF